MDRKVYVEALRTERARVVETHPDDAGRLKQIDAELAKYDDKPTERKVESAVPKGKP